MKFKDFEIKIKDFQPIVHWQTRVQKRKTSYRITIKKEVAGATGIKSGKVLDCYMTYINNRPVVVTFLDGNGIKF